MYKVIAKCLTKDYRWERTTTKPFIMKEEADREHEKQAFIARDRLAKREIVDYQIETIETFK